MAYGIDKYDFSKVVKNIEELIGNSDGQDWPGIKPFAGILIGLITGLRAKLVLEIGTGGLWSTQCFLYGLEKTDGKIISCDSVKRFKEFHHPRLQFINKCSSEVAKNWKQQIDILFIDGDHHYEAVKQDYKLFFPFVRKGGLVIFHDTNHSWYPGIKKAVNEIKGQKINFNEFPGLVILQK